METRILEVKPPAGTTIWQVQALLDPLPPVVWVEPLEEPERLHVEIEVCDRFQSKPEEIIEWLKEQTPPL